MRGGRTVEEFVREIDHVAGIKIRIGWTLFLGIFLKDTETGLDYALGQGTSKKTLLSPREQESICRSLNREHLLDLLGLDPDSDSD